MIFTAEEAEELGIALGIDWDEVDFTPEDLAAGMDIELEHGTARDPRVNITEDDPTMTAQIALAHLLEYSNYYADEGLMAMEDQLAELLEKEARTRGLSPTCRRTAYQIEKQVKQEVRKDMSPELKQYVQKYVQGIQDLTDGGMDAGEAFEKTQPDLDDLTADDLVNLLWENQHLGGRGALTKLAPMLSVLDIFDVIQKLLERAIWDASRLWWGKQKTQEAEPPARTPEEQEAAEQRDSIETVVQKPKKDASAAQLTMQQFTYRGHVYVPKQAVTKTCEQRDQDTGRPATEQKVCLFSEDGTKLLGRHPDKQSADEQEAAIHARGGQVQQVGQQGNKLVEETKMQYIKLAEVPEAAVKSLYQDKWGEGIMKALGEDFPLDSKAAQFLFFSVWNGVIQLMDKSLMGREVDTTQYADDPTFMQSLAGLSYFVTDDAIKSSLGLSSDSLEKGAGHAEALMAVLGKEADVGKTLEGLKGQAGPIVEKAFDQVTGYLANEPEQKAAGITHGNKRAQLFCAFVRQAAQSRFILTMYYDVVTPESAEYGDVDHRGYSVEGNDYPLEDGELPPEGDELVHYDTLEELADDLEYSHSWEGWSGYPAVPGNWIISQPEEDYQDGSNTTYDAFITHQDGSKLSLGEMEYVHERLGLYGEVTQQQRELPLEAQTNPRVEAVVEEPAAAPIELDPEPTATQPTTPDQTIQAWVAGLPRDAHGPMAIRLYDVVAQDGSREDYRAAAAQEGLYCPAGKLDVPYLQDYLRQEMNNQAAVLLNDGPAGRVGTFEYAERQGQWGLEYSTPAVEDLIPLVAQQAAKQAGRKTDRGPDHRPLGRDRDSRAPSMQLTQQVGQQLGREVREREPVTRGREPESTKEQQDSKFMRALKWLRDKSHEAAPQAGSQPGTTKTAGVSPWGRVREASKKRIDTRGKTSQATTKATGCGCSQPKEVPAMNKTAETFRGFNLNVVPELAKSAIYEIKHGQEGDFDNQDSGFEYYLEDVVRATGIPEDWAEALGIPTDDTEWANAVEGGWEWDYIQEAIDEIDDKLAEAMDRSGLPGGLSLGSNEGSGDFGLIYFIDYDEAEQQGIVDPTQTERRW